MSKATQVTHLIESLDVTLIADKSAKFILQTMTLRNKVYIFHLIISNGYLYNAYEEFYSDLVNFLDDFAEAVYKTWSTAEYPLESSVESDLVLKRYDETEVYSELMVFRETCADLIDLMKDSPYSAGMQDSVIALLKLVDKLLYKFKNLR